MCTLFGWPKPTGPFKVGLTTWLITDPSRLEPFDPGSTTRREFMAHIWYPAQPGPKDDPLGGNVAFPEAGGVHPPPPATPLLRPGPLPAPLRHLIHRLHPPRLASHHLTFVGAHALAAPPRGGAT